jgi:hypothetical protein
MLIRDSWRVGRIMSGGEEPSGIGRSQTRDQDRDQMKRTVGQGETRIVEVEVRINDHQNPRRPAFQPSKYLPLEILARVKERRKKKQRLHPWKKK